ncbi:MAG TPA: UDP-glucuronic acid decarboxylase family protein [Actinomycetota bacterium]
MKILVTGGAGFLGSHLCERLVADGHDTWCYDSLLTGSLDNLASLVGTSAASPASPSSGGAGRFTFRHVDVTWPIVFDGPLDWVLHLASPASPRDYLDHPIHTLKVGALGTLNVLGLAKAKGAGVLLASTSEVYGDPLVHPQVEEYRGNVNSIGPRGVYDEAKRYAEALVMAYHRAHDMPTRIVRIFNTYGPRMRPADGRAVPTFIAQGLAGERLTVHGDGSQTRSLCYVDDLVEGIVRLLLADGARVGGIADPVNLGNPEEITVLSLAERVRDLTARFTGRPSPISFTDRPVDDPEQRCPDIARARGLLGWAPVVSLDEGLARTVEWCFNRWLQPGQRPPDRVLTLDATPGATHLR